MTYETFFAERDVAPPAAQHRSSGTWQCVRRDYLAGEAAPALAERYGVSLSAIRARARAEGWRRADLPDPAPAAPEDEEVMLAEPPASPAELRALAWARAARAVRRGRLSEALGWTRLVRQLDVLAEKAAAGPALQARAADSLARAADTLAALRATRPAPPTPHEMHDLHDLHEVHPPSPSAPPERSGESGPRTADAPCTPGSRIGCAVRDDRNGEFEDPDVPASSAGRDPDPPLRPPTGPAAPLVPPAWVRHALAAR